MGLDEKKLRRYREMRIPKEDPRAEGGIKAVRSSDAYAGESLSLLPPKLHP